MINKSTKRIAKEIVKEVYHRAACHLAISEPSVMPAEDPTRFGWYLEDEIKKLPFYQGLLVEAVIESPDLAGVRHLLDADDDERVRAMWKAVDEVKAHNEAERQKRS